MRLYNAFFENPLVSVIILPLHKSPLSIPQGHSVWRTKTHCRKRSSCELDSTIINIYYRIMKCLIWQSTHYTLWLVWPEVTLNAPVTHFQAHTHTFPLGMESRVALFCSRIVSAGDFALKLLGTVYERAFGVKASSHTCSMSQPGTPHTHFQTIVKLIFHKPGIKDFLFFSFSPLFFRHLDALLSAVRSKHLYWPFWSLCTDTVAVSVLSWGLRRKQSERLARLEGLQTEPGTEKGFYN